MIVAKVPGESAVISNLINWKYPIIKNDGTPSDNYGNFVLLIHIMAQDGRK